MNLNDRQREAIEATEGPVLVLAGAGSGKTRVLTERIAKLIADGKAKPWEILAITFTNKAAAEMRTRIQDAVDFDIADMWVCTFHAMCVRILRKYAEFLGYTSQFVIYDTSDMRRMLKAILEDEGYKGHETITDKALARLISRYKNSDGTKNFGTMAHDELPIGAPDAQRIFDTYEQRMREENAMDFDDLLGNTLHLLEHDEEARRYYQDKFKYVLIDEYQDTNPVQYKIAKILSEGSGNIFAVGDDDQSIYAFRGATIRNILEFEHDFPGATTIRLEQNYRSTQPILNVANAIIANNPSRPGKTLWTDSGEGELPLIYTAKDEREEASFICQDIQRLHDEEGVSYSDMAVLYRSHPISRVIEEKLKNNGINYVVYGGRSFYDRKEIKDMIAYLSIIASPQSDVQLLRILNTPKRGIGEMKLAQLKKIAQTEHVSYMDVLANAESFIKDKVLGKKANEFWSLYRRISDGYEELPVHLIVERVYELSGYRRMLEEENSAEARGQMENIAELIRGAEEFDDTEGGGLVSYLQSLTLMTGQDEDIETEVPDERLTLMTMHAAKGLEFDVVYLAGMVENLFPNQKAIESKTIDEERRLCYVAVTRARKYLVFVSSHSRRAYGRPQQSDLSRFLKEIPEGSVRIMDPQKEAQEKAQLAPKRFMSSASAARKARPEPKFFTGGAFVPPKLKEKQADDGFRVGIRVRHAMFGDGTISKMLDTDDGKMAQVDYEHSGSKIMMLAYARLEILD